MQPVLVPVVVLKVTPILQPCSNRYLLPVSRRDALWQQFVGHTLDAQQVAVLGSLDLDQVFHQDEPPTLALA